MPFRKARPQYLLLSLLLIWSTMAQVAISGYQIFSANKSKQTGILPFHIDLAADSLMLRSYDDDLRKIGLLPGDELVALNGEIITGFRQLERRRFSWRPGQQVRVTVRRQDSGTAHTIDRVVSVRLPHRGALDWTFTIVLYTVIPIFSLILGFFVAFSRPHDKLAWLTLAMMASFSQLGPANLFGLPDPWMELVIGYRSLMTNTWPLWVMLFGMYFPSPFDFLRKYKWPTVLLSIPFLVLLVVDIYTDIYDASRIASIRRLAEIESHFESPIRIFFIICTASFFVSIAIKLANSRTPDARRRLQWLLVGSAAALLPSLALQALQTLFQIDIPFGYWVTSILAITLFPLTLAYVIVVQRAMDVRVALRIGVRHAFARGGITALRIILSAIVILLAVDLAVAASGMVAPSILLTLSIGLLALVGRMGTKLGQWTDRKFFREAYDTEVILTELSENVAGIRDTKELLETVTQQISGSLHVPRVAVLLRTSETFQSAYTQGYERPPAVELGPGMTTVHLLETERKPVLVYFDDDNSWVRQASDKEREILRLLEAQLLLPITLKERLLGIISLGPKRSEAPYSKADMRLLSAVASQTGLALENARLTEGIKREVAERERINRELEIAREVQQRLFPQTLPVIPELDLAGYCRPQQDVGGDYYDFFRLGDGCLAMAIGDVSGKGIGAALMMATLQASLRSQTLRASDGPAQTLELMNRLVYDASSPNRYATFFYAQYSPHSGSLTYVNAGHNAPILCRNVDGVHQIVRLETGGTVLGLFPESSYQEDCIRLCKGDLLVGFTDGISEAMNTKDEEWEEDNLIQAVSECHGLGAHETIRYILSRVDAFTQGAKQHDDMTLLVIKVR
jgi:sigma-B regulation protein RsbU (phosphoserine phosphatase)